MGRRKGGCRLRRGRGRGGREVEVEVEIEPAFMVEMEARVGKRFR